MARTKHGQEKNKKKNVGDALKKAYTSITYSPRERVEECRPDSPQFFFSSSHDVKFSDSLTDVDGKDAVFDLQQVVHKHANGLCMVTAGDLSLPPSKALKSILFVEEEAPQVSNSKKRKRQAKMLKGKASVDNIVTPSTVMAELTLEDKNNGIETMIPLRACVWGTVIEVNKTVSFDSLLNDPLLDGQ